MNQQTNPNDPNFTRGLPFPGPPPALPGQGLPLAGLPLPGMNPGLPMPPLPNPRGLPLPPQGLPIPGEPEKPSNYVILKAPPQMMPPATNINLDRVVRNRGETHPEVNFMPGGNPGNFKNTLPLPPEKAEIQAPNMPNNFPAPRLNLPGPGMNIPPGLNVPNPGLNLPGPGLNVPKPGLNLPGPGLNVPNPGLNLPSNSGMSIPSNPGLNLPKPGMNIPQVPGNNFPSPGMNFPPAPRLNPTGPGINLPQGPGLKFPPVLPQPGNVPNPPQNMPIGMNIAGLPVPPNFPSQKHAPVPPQAFPQSSHPGILDASNPSISIKRVSLSKANIDKANKDGRFNEIMNKNPGINLFSNNAGPGQSFINIVGNPQSVNSSYNILRTLETQDSQWYYLHNDGTFQAYETSVNNLIENGFTNGLEATEIFTNGNSYMIIYGQNNFPHQQILQGGEVYRTVRRGREPASQNFSHGVVKWFWANEVANKWEQYEPEACQLIESHYQTFANKYRGRSLSALPNKEEIAKSESVLVSGTSGFSYLMDFVNMVQRNEKTRRWRAIKKDGLNCTFRVSQVTAEPTPWINHPDPQLG